MDEILDEKTYETRSLEVASFPERLAAFLLDAALFLALNYGIYFLVGYNTDLWGFIWAYAWQEGLGVTFYFIYFDGGEKNATFGKQIMDIRLLNEYKRDIGFADAAKHFILSLLLFPGFLNSLFNEKHQTLADKLTKIVLIRRSK